MKILKLLNKTLKLGLLVAVIPVSLYANDYDKDNPKDEELSKARVQVIAALQANNEDLIEESIDIMSELVQKQYTPQRASYLGALTAKMAIFSFFPWTKIGYADDGSEILDKAIKKAPNSIDVRLNRMNTYINFPDMLKKSLFVQDDARWLLQMLKKKDFTKETLDSIHKVLAMFFAKQEADKRYKYHFNQIQKEKYKKDVLEFIEKR